MGENRAGSLGREGVAALTYMENAIQLLDTFEPGVEVAAHLDLAICRLREAIESASPARPSKDRWRRA